MGVPVGGASSRDKSFSKCSGNARAAGAARGVPDVDARRTARPAGVSVGCGDDDAVEGIECDGPDNGVRAPVPLASFDAAAGVAAPLIEARFSGGVWGALFRGVLLPNHDVVVGVEVGVRAASSAAVVASLALRRLMVPIAVSLSSFKSDLRSFALIDFSSSPYTSSSRFSQ